MASPIPNSHICCGSQEEAHTFLASFLQSSNPNTTDNLVHQSRVSHFSAFHGTHWLNSMTTGSGGILSPSSSEVSSNPLKKDATASPSSGLLQIRAFTGGSFLTRPCLQASGAVGGRGVLKLHLLASPLPLLPTSSPVIPNLGSCPHFQAVPGVT